MPSRGADKKGRVPDDEEQSNSSPGAYGTDGRVLYASEELSFIFGARRAYARRCPRHRASPARSLSCAARTKSGSASPAST